MHTEPAGQVGQSAAFRVTGLRPHAQPCCRRDASSGLHRPRARSLAARRPAHAGGRRQGPRHQRGRRARHGQVAAGVRGHARDDGAPGGHHRFSKAAACRTAASCPICRWSICSARTAACSKPIRRRRSGEAIDQAVRNNGLPADAGAWLLRLIGIVDEPPPSRSLSPEAVKARTFDALAPVVPEGLGQPAARDRRRGRALDRSHVGGVPHDAGRPAARGPDPARCDLPAGLPRAVDGTLVCHADHDRPAQRRRERASCSARSPAIKPLPPRSRARSCSAARAIPCSSRSSPGRSPSTAPASR